MIQKQTGWSPRGYNQPFMPCDRGLFGGTVPSAGRRAGHGLLPSLLQRARHRDRRCRRVGAGRSCWRRGAGGVEQLLRAARHGAAAGDEAAGGRRGSDAAGPGPVRHGVPARKTGGFGFNLPT